MLVKNKTLENQTVELDGMEFQGCIFKNCLIQFNGKAQVVGLSDCQFHGCKLGMGGGADLTVQYLKAIYHGLGDWGSESVEMLFNEIRKPPPQKMH